MKKKNHSSLVRQLRLFAKNLLKASVWYRGQGFDKKDPQNVALREARAETLESDAMSIRSILKEHDA